MLIPRFPRSPKLIRLSESSKDGLQKLAKQFYFVSANGNPRISDILEAIGLYRFKIFPIEPTGSLNKESHLIRVSNPANHGLTELTKYFGFISSKDRPIISNFLEALGQGKFKLVPIEDYDLEDEWYIDGYEDGYNREDQNYDIIAEAIEIEKTQRDYCLYMAGYYAGLHKRLTDEKA